MKFKEKLGSFYLGREYDFFEKKVLDRDVEYDSRDLMTHAVCVGMTGSGKTGLCLSLLEEAAIDGVPAIAIDPKGDLANLLLTFPDLRGSDFEPWVDPAEATRRGKSPTEMASATADLWRKGLADWGQGPERIALFEDSVDRAIYTPGSNAGLPLTVLRSFDAPSPEVLNNSDALRERINSAASGLLALLGLNADPIQSREHILLASLLNDAWTQERDLDIAGLIQGIQRPPFERVGVIDLEGFYPASERTALAMRLNNLLASPTFASWLEGEPLDVKRLLHTPEGKPRLSILSIAHLSESERMFFVTILLNEVLAWARSQPGASSLRAMLYMDEVFGYFPPVANPPSKQPMLTLLKQARAFGLGVMLATQNPVDLDYKGLSNTGTWFLGRLQTERDKARVIEGLEGAAAQTGARLDRAELEQTLAGLGSRVFLMNNVHDDRPVVFHTRWALSYLRGPLTRDQIRNLMQDRGDAAAADDHSQTELVASEPIGVERPILPADVREWFVRPKLVPQGRDRLVYRPALLGRVKAHYSRSTYDLDHWTDLVYVARLGEELDDDPWRDAVETLDRKLVREDHAESGATFSPAPVELTRARSYSSWAKDLKDFVYRNRPLALFRAKKLGEYSQPGESIADFRVRLGQRCREERDVKVEKLREKYRRKIDSLERQAGAAEHRLEREQAEAQSAQLDGVMSMGAALLGAFLGRKLATRSNVSKVTTSARRISRASRQKGDVARAQEKLDDPAAATTGTERGPQARSRVAGSRVPANRTRNRRTQRSAEEIRNRRRRGRVAVAAVSSRGRWNRRAIIRGCVRRDADQWSASRRRSGATLITCDASPHA